MSLLAVSFGDRFCVSRKDRTGVGGLVRLMGANTGLGLKRSWLALGGLFLSPMGD